MVLVSGVEHGEGHFGVIPFKALDGGICDGASGVIGNGIREGDKDVVENSGASFAFGVLACGIEFFI